MKTPEGYEKADIDKYLESIDAYVVKPTTGGYGASGHADRLCCIGGVFVAIEVKREGKEPTPLQWRRIHEVEEAGGFAFWGTAEKVIAELKVAFA
jgi:hypothetical protein